MIRELEEYQIVSEIGLISIKNVIAAADSW